MELSELCDNVGCFAAPRYLVAFRRGGHIFYARLCQTCKDNWTNRPWNYDIERIEEVNYLSEFVDK